MLNKADPTLIRRINADLVLRLIRDAGPISRAEVSRRSRLSGPAVSDVVASLLRRRLVREEGVGASTGGRRPTLLRFVPDAAFAVALDLDGEAIHAGLLNLAGTVIRETRAPIRSRAVGPLSRTIAGLAREIIRTEPHGPVVGVGIGVPGVVRPGSRTISLSRSLGWEGIDLRRPLEQMVGLPVWIENRANAAALGEFWCGVGEGRHDLVFVSIRVGIGAGIILGGQLYCGVAGAAGEIGYMAVDRTALRRRPADFGALERLASARALAERLGHRSGPQTALGVLAAARPRHRAAARVWRETAQAWGMAVANLTAVLNPDLVVIGGSLADAGDWILEEIRAVLERLVPMPPRLLPSALKGRAVLCGGGAQVFAELYDLGPWFPSRLLTLAGE